MAGREFHTTARISLTDEITKPLSALVKHVGTLNKEMAAEAVASNRLMAEQVGHAHAAMATEIERAQQQAGQEVARVQAAMRTEFRQTSREMGQMARGQQRAASEIERAQAGMAAGSRRHFTTMAEAAKNAAGLIGTAMAGIATATAKAAAHDGYTLDVAMTRLKALAGNITPEQADRLQRQAESSPFIGSPVDVAAGYTAAVQSGITNPDSMIASVEAAKAFQIAAGRSTGELPSLAEAEKMILEHAQMLEDITDELGHRITPSQATPGQLSRAELSAAGRLEAFAQAGGGDSNKAYEFNKFAAPSALAAHVPVADLLEMGAQLGRNGIQGSLAGVAMRSITGSLLAPTAKARTQFRELGIKYSRFVEVDASRMDEAKIAHAMELRAGPLNAGTRRNLARDLEAFKRTHDLQAYQDAAATDLQASGSRNMKNPVSAQTLARDASTGFVTKLDVEGMMAALKAAGASIGAYNQIFGTKAGGNAALIDPVAIAAPNGIRSIIRAREPEAMGQAIIEEQRRSYGATVDAGSNAVTGTLTSLFEPWKAPIADLTRQFIGLSGAIRGLSDPQKAAIGGASLGVAVSGAALSLRWMLGLAKGKPEMPRPAETPPTEPSPAPAVSESATRAERSAASEGARLRTQAEAQWKALTGGAAPGTTATPPAAAPPPGAASGTPAGGAVRSSQLGEPPEGQAIQAAGGTGEAARAASAAGRFTAEFGRVLGPVFRLLARSNDLSVAFDPDRAAATFDRVRDLRSQRRQARGGGPLPPGAPTAQEQRQAVHTATVAGIAASAQQAADAAAKAGSGAGSLEAGGTGGATGRTPAAGNFLVPPASKGGTPDRTSAPAREPQLVHVEGEAVLQQVLDVRMTGSDVFAEAIMRKVDSRIKVNLGQAMTGGQGLQPAAAR